ncbi:caspase family protein [Aulosira sp. FACHB-615]|uniref:caspase family protein n=1 Tax=Aulosira sp. FACHB-615 TaxID=2692777 RepID=UPI0016870464|nr:caspase family protein [Aulosira sp. FACHB-615]MBD2491688.1 caspase family protein [Aulosira sp. FACHB-615]
MGKNWAIVVGINNYDNLQPLKYAKRDAEAMKAWFENEANFDQVFLFTEDSAPIPANPPIPTLPTQGRFKRFLNAQFEEPLLKPEDNLWFFFAGHGKRFVDQDYLMFLDSDPTDYTTAISVDYVTQRLRRCGADNVVLLIDACRDEGDRSGLGVGMQEHKGVITFYSCAASQKSWEIDELQHGSFTYSLLEGLRLQGEANCATVERLEQHLRYRVPELNAYYKKSEQHPSLKAEPPYKMYYILLEQAARIRDVEPLKYQALLAENRGDLLLAKQLWVRVLAVSRGDWEAVEAIERIAMRQGESFEPTITDELTILASGGRSTQELALTQNQAKHEQNSTSQERISRQKFLKWIGLGGITLGDAIVIVGSENFKGQLLTPTSTRTLLPTSNTRIFLLAGTNNKTKIINDLKSELIRAGFNVFGAQQIEDDTRPNEPEVRYFNRSDEEQADIVVKFVRSRLSNQVITAKYYDDSSGKPGYIEIWLGR